MMRVVGRRLLRLCLIHLLLEQPEVRPRSPSENCARRAPVIFSTFSFRWASSNFWTAFCFVRMGWRARAPPRHTEGNQQAALSAPGSARRPPAPLYRW